MQSLEMAMKYFPCLRKYFLLTLAITSDISFFVCFQWIIYWVVVRGPQLFFFKDSDTQNKENVSAEGLSCWVSA